MPELVNLRPTSHELHLRATRERSRAINTLLRRVARSYAQWFAALAHHAARLARDLADERQLRRDIGVLQRHTDRELADMGLGHSEIEHIVRRGRAAAPRDQIFLAPPHPHAKAGRPSV